jgi:hypothetical protein
MAINLIFSGPGLGTAKVRSAYGYKLVLKKFEFACVSVYENGGF